MAIKEWRTLNTYLILAILSLCKIYIPCAAERSIIPIDKSNVIDKYMCKSGHSENLHDQINSTTTKLAEIISTHTIKLNCSKPITYVSVTETEFDRGIEANGELDIVSLHRKLEPRTYCVTEFNGPSVRIAFCNESSPQLQHNYTIISATISNSPVTLRKCCPSKSRLVKTIENRQELFRCVNLSTDWNPAIFNSTSDEYYMHQDLRNLTHMNITYGFPYCSGLPNSLNNSKDIWFMVLAGGSVEIGLKFWFKPVWLPLQDSEFCLDEFLDHDPSSHRKTEVDSHSIYHKNQILLYCQIPHFDDYLFHRRLFGGICVAAAGIVFILLVIYVAIWDKQNLAGWTQFNIFVALFFVVLMEGLRTLFDADGLQVQSTTTCVIVAAIAQYFFFALNTTWSVMCFDLFYMFWKLETTSKTFARYKSRLVFYLLFSWGLPLVVVFIAFYFNHHNATEEMDEMKGVYAFAHRRCSSPIRKLGFQTQGIMFLLNLVFFFLTTLLLWKHRRGLNSARKRSRNERHTWRSVCLFMKLVVVMGVASLSIPVDYFFVSSAPLSSTAICFRMVHFIPFFAVLFIFGFNEKNVILISQKYPRVGKYFGFVACTSGATISDTANHSRSGANRISDHPSSPT